MYFNIAHENSMLEIKFHIFLVKLLRFILHPDYISFTVPKNCQH